MYMDYYGSFMPNPNLPLGLVTLEYDANGKILKRKSGPLPLASSSGYDFYFSDSLYEDLAYQPNQITITKKDAYKNLDVPPDRKVIFLENEKMVRAITERTGNLENLDTTYFYYAQDKVVRTVLKDRNTVHTKAYFYNGAGNLTLIKGHGIDRYTQDTTYLQLETFENYDQAANPVKNLYMFDELFLRSLSTNNYQKYTRHQYSKDSTTVSKETKNWILKYDAAGNVRFDQ